MLVNVFIISFAMYQIGRQSVASETRASESVLETKDGVMFEIVRDNQMGSAILLVHGRNALGGLPLDEFDSWLQEYWNQKYPDRIFLSLGLNACEMIVRENPTLPFEMVLRYTLAKYYPLDKYAVGGLTPEDRGSGSLWDYTHFYTLSNKTTEGPAPEESEPDSP